jgi:hypothetical protein
MRIALGFHSTRAGNLRASRITVHLKTNILENATEYRIGLLYRLRESSVEISARKRNMTDIFLSFPQYL